MVFCPGGWGVSYSQLSFMNSFKESFWTSFFLGAAQPRQQGQARHGEMVTVPMIAVLDRCWLRATMIEARSQRGGSRERKSCCWWWLLELLGFGVGFAGAIVCFAVRAFSSASSVSNEAAREGQERVPERWWHVLGCTE